MPALNEKAPENDEQHKTQVCRYRELGKDRVHHEITARPPNYILDGPNGPYFIPERYDRFSIFPTQFKQIRHIILLIPKNNNGQD